MDFLDLEIAKAKDQQTDNWFEERKGRLTSSRYVDMMSMRAPGTKTRRARLKKQLDKKEITQKAYNAEISDCVAIENAARFGDGCMTYIYEKVAEILTNSYHIKTSQATDWGLDYEQEAQDFYEKKTDNQVTQVGFITYGDYAGGSPDGLINDDGIIEIKCPFNPANYARVLITKEVPKQDIFQLQGNLMATDRKYCDFISYDPRVVEKSLRMVVIRVRRNEEIIEAIKDRIKEVVEKLHQIIKEIK
ncbi:hypothetical protein LCGC14_0371170 [marine sediment metagenome]|uniref:YqaJ viral recombinase domain-containing protein n=1 Tax=marine sediment metagenome TaxID=412755 RepID=A0A0F9VSJ8_9ZZZZ|nr:lambda exonuclease family protein [Maribacter sp.]HDZ04873.1 hypothetical protein [Maribacter sp.]HEA80840.1 hypothetical protein [Maribacter sp.]